MPLQTVIDAVPRWRESQKIARLYRDYIEGRHQLHFASPDFQKKYAQTLENMGIRENLCPAVVSAIADKVAVASWGTKEAIDEAANAGLERILDQVVFEAVGCSEAWILVWPNAKGEPTPHFHRAGTFVGNVDELNPDQLESAVHLWFTRNGYGRAVVYGRDVAERFITTRAFGSTETAPSLDDMPVDPRQWIEYDGDGDPAVIKNADPGVCPVIYIPADPILNDVIPLQDALNKSLANLIINEESYARPFRYLLRYKAPEATNPFLPTGQGGIAAAAVQGARTRFDPQRQQIFTHDGEGPFGQLDPPDLTHILDVQDRYATKIGRVVGIPGYYLTSEIGDVPSGRSLQIVTSRLTSKILRLIRTIEPALRGMMQLLGHDVSQIKFASVIPESAEENLANATTEKELGLPPEIWLRTAGYDPGMKLADGRTLAESIAQQSLAQKANTDVYGG